MYSDIWHQLKDATLPLQSRDPPDFEMGGGGRGACASMSITPIGLSRFQNRLTPLI
jgi:hypothetical protein